MDSPTGAGEVDPNPYLDARRENDSLPRDEDSRLSILDRGRVLANQPRALRYQQVVACPAVIYVLTNLSGDFAG